MKDMQARVDEVVNRESRNPVAMAGEFIIVT